MNCYIGCNISQHGMGSRVQRILNIVALSFYLKEKYNLNIEYLHIPLYYEGFGIDFSMGEDIRPKVYDAWHRDGYIKMAKKWEENLNYSGIDINHINIDDFTIVNLDINEFDELFNDIKLNNCNNKIYLVTTIHQLIGNDVFDIEIMNLYRNDIFNLFKINKNMSDEVIVHIRRLDAINYNNRFLNDEYYLNIINKLEDRNYKNILITTQRKNFNSDTFKNYKIIYDDEINDAEMFIRMVNAKVLVISKSSYSYAAGLICDGLVISPVMDKDHKKLKSWLYNYEL